MQRLPTAASTRSSGRSRAGVAAASPATCGPPKARTCSAGSQPVPTCSARTSGPAPWRSGDSAPATSSPDLVYVRISAFGQDGPYALRPGLDRLGIAYGGLLQLTGERDRPPVRPGVTISDYLTGVFAALAAVAGLYERRAAPSAATESDRDRRRALRVDPPSARMDTRRLRPHRDGPHPRGEPDGQLGAARQFPHCGRRLRLHRGGLGCQLRPALPGHGAPGADRGPALLDAARRGSPAARRSTIWSRPGQAASTPRRSRRLASHTGCRSAPRTPPPRSSPTPTWPPGGIW